jgi:hypothetical protein
MKKNYIIFAFFLLVLSSCDKNYRAIKKISGNWKLTSAIRNGVAEDLNILKIKLTSTYDVGDSWFGEYHEDNITANGEPYSKEEDLQIEFSSKGKTATFHYKYGSITGWTEVYEVIKLKKDYMKLKYSGEENYYVFER